jgi:hypothetical protein
MSHRIVTAAAGAVVVLLVLPASGQTVTASFFEVASIRPMSMLLLRGLQTER